MSYDPAEDHYYLGKAMLLAGDKIGARAEWEQTLRMTKDHRITSEAKEGLASIRVVSTGQNFKQSQKENLKWLK